MNCEVTLTFTGSEQKKVEYALNPIRLLASPFHQDLLEPLLAEGGKRNDETAEEFLIRKCRGCFFSRGSLKQVEYLSQILAALLEVLRRESKPEFQSNWITISTMEASLETLRENQGISIATALFTDPIGAMNALQETRKEQAVRAEESYEFVKHCLHTLRAAQIAVDSINESVIGYEPLE